MDAIIEQYFDLVADVGEPSEVLDGFRYTLQLSLVAGVLALVWGLILAVLRQIPGRVGLLIRVPTIVYIDAFRGVPMLLVVLLIYGSFGALTQEDVISASSSGSRPGSTSPTSSGTASSRSR